MSTSGDINAELLEADDARFKLAAIVMCSEYAIILESLEGVIVSWNPGAERLYGYTPGEIVGKPASLLCPQGRENDQQKIVERIKAGKCVEAYETLLRRKDGKLVDVTISMAPMENRHGQIVGAVQIAHDISQRRIIEEQFRQAQKMEAVGRLAGGVAHDFNNVLTIISGYSEMMLGSLPVDDPARELAKEINRAGERAAALTRQLLAFSRQQLLKPTILDLNAVLNDTKTMLGRLIGEDVKLTVALEPELAPIKADASQLQQVIMNLAINARDAMPEGGSLTIETRHVELDDTYAKTHVEVIPGHYILLSVSDTGCGMDEATKARIFEPFFSTKEPGKGTGLGLATVYGIVKQSGGHIACYSKPGIGTTFKIYLPQHAQAPAAPQSQVALPKPMETGSETILVVEDEDAVRELAQHILEARGYIVLAARDGEEAIRLAVEHRDAIDLLLTDVVMPRMSGRKVAESLRRCRPKIKVLYLSGYTDDAIVRQGIVDLGNAFLQKPYSPAVLCRKVREVLDTKASPRAEQGPSGLARGT